MVAPLEVADGLTTEATLGQPLDLVVAPSGEPALVYGAVPAGSTERWLRYAERAGPDDWRVEDIGRPGAQAPNQRTLLAVSAATWGGTVHAAYLGGDHDDNGLTRYPTDLMLATRGPGGWTEQTLVDGSGEAAGTCPDLQNYCNTGHVVGSHAALAAAPDGSRFAVLYRDTHIGFGDDDLRRADAELYIEPGGPRLVDAERGAGAWGHASFLPGGELAVAYQVSSDFAGADARGLWLWVEGEAAPVKLTATVTSHRLALASAPDGTLWLAFFDAVAEDLVVGYADPPYQDWTFDPVDASGSVGLYPDLAIDADGSPRVVYGYCGRDGGGCPGSPGRAAEVRMAWPTEQGWETGLVTDGEGLGGVGFFNRVIALSDGRLAVATQDADRGDVLVALVEVRR